MGRIVFFRIMKKETTDIVFYDNEKMIEQAKDALVSKTITSREKLNQILDQCKSLADGGIKSLPEHQAVKEAIKVLKKINTEVPKQRKVLTEPATTYQKSLIQEEKEIIDLVTPVLSELLKVDQKAEDAIMAKSQELFQERSKKLAELGYQLTSSFFILGAFQVHSDQLVKLTDDEFKFYMDKGQEEIERKEKESGLQDELTKALEQIELLKKQNEALQPKDEVAPETTIPGHTAQPPASEQIKSNTANPYRSESFVARAKSLLTCGYTAFPNDSKFTRGTEEMPYDVLLNMEQEQFDTYIQGQKPADTREFSEFEKGWNAFRDKFIALMEDESKQHKRPALIQWANELKP